MDTAEDAVLAAMRSLRGERTIDEVASWIDQRYPGRWVAIGTTMADLTHPPNNSTQYPPERQFLERVRPGVYRLRAGW